MCVVASTLLKGDAWSGDQEKADVIAPIVPLKSVALKVQCSCWKILAAPPLSFSRMTICHPPVRPAAGEWIMPLFSGGKGGVPWP